MIGRTLDYLLTLDDIKSVGILLTVKREPQVRLKTWRVRQNVLDSQQPIIVGGIALRERDVTDLAIRALRLVVVVQVSAFDLK